MSLLGTKTDVMSRAKKVGKVSRKKTQKKKQSSGRKNALTIGDHVLTLEKVYESGNKLAFMFSSPETNEKLFINTKSLDVDEKESYSELLEFLHKLTGLDYDEENWIDFFTDCLCSNAKKIIGKKLLVHIRRRPKYHKYSGKDCYSVSNKDQDAEETEIKGFKTYMLDQSNFSENIKTDLYWCNTNNLIKHDDFYVIAEDKKGTRKLLFTQPFAMLSDCEMVDDTVEETINKIKKDDNIDKPGEDNLDNSEDDDDTPF